MFDEIETLTIRANIEITPRALEAIVENSKKIAGKNENGIFTVDTAEKASEMITRFLIEKDLEGYVEDIENFEK